MREDENDEFADSTRFVGSENRTGHRIVVWRQLNTKALFHSQGKMQHVGSHVRINSRFFRDEKIISIARPLKHLMINNIINRDYTKWSLKACFTLSVQINFIIGAFEYSTRVRIKYLFTTMTPCVITTQNANNGRIIKNTARYGCCIMHLFLSETAQ